MTRRGMIWLMASAATVTLTGCGFSSSASYRFRMTVEVETPQGTKTGSSVMEVLVSRGMAIGDASGVSSVVRGQAVTVELPDGPIFILLQMPDAGPPLQEVVGDALLGKPSPTPDAVMANIATLGAAWLRPYRADLPRTRDNGKYVTNNNWPTMVRFRDIDDPKSVERVDPDAIGVKRITLETTRDPVTMGIEKRLSWLTKKTGFSSQFLAYNGFIPAEKLTIADEISPRDFSTEIGK